MKLYEQFIDENKEYLQARLNEATSKGVRVMGFPIYSANEAFEKVVTKADLYYLPYCLYLIQFGVGVSQDKSFSMKAFSELLANEKSYSEIPMLAYVCAYCENRDGDLDFSEKILDCLTKQNFPPALVTRGDLSWIQKDKERAKRYYQHSADLGHVIAKIRYLRVSKRGPQFLRKVSLFFNIVIVTLSKKSRGNKYLYMTFYNPN